MSDQFPPEGPPTPPPGDDGVNLTPPPPPAGATPPPPPPPPPPAPGAVPPPPAPGYAAAPAAGSSVDVGSAFSWAMAKFQQHAGIWIGLAAVVFVLQAVNQIISRVMANAAANNCSNSAVTINQDGSITGGGVTCATGLFANIGITLVLGVIFGALVWLASIGVYRAALKRSQGETPDFSMLTSGENLGAYIVVAILYGIAIFVGLILCIIPGLIVAFLFQFAPLYALDKGQSVGEAFGNSYRAVMSNFVPVIVAAIVNIVASFLGSILFGVLSLVTLPFAALFTVHIYRQLNKEPVVTT